MRQALCPVERSLERMDWRRPQLPQEFVQEPQTVARPQHPKPRARQGQRAGHLQTPERSLERPMLRAAQARSPVQARDGNRTRRGGARIRSRKARQLLRARLRRRQFVPMADDEGHGSPTARTSFASLPHFRRAGPRARSASRPLPDRASGRKHSAVKTAEHKSDPRWTNNRYSPSSGGNDSVCESL